MRNLFPLALLVVSALFDVSVGYTRVPPESLLLNRADFLAEALGHHWISLYCIDGDDNVAIQLDCSFKSGFRWAQIPGDGSGAAFIRKSAESWQPRDNGVCINLPNLDFIIPAEQDCRGKAILYKVDDNEVHRIFSSDPTRYLILHACIDETAITEDGYCPDTLTFIMIKDPRSTPGEELDLQEVPWNYITADLIHALGLVLGPASQQFLPPPHPKYVFVGPECPPAELNETIPHAALRNPPPVFPPIVPPHFQFPFSIPSSFLGNGIPNIGGYFGNSFYNQGGRK